MRETLKRMRSLRRLMPDPLWQLARRSSHALEHLALWPAATFHPWRQRSRRQLAAYASKHAGRRCFIIGNGPSLKRMDLSVLRDEFTFGMNRIYLLFPELGFSTTYFVSVNSLVIEQCAADIRALPIPKFLSWRSRKLVSAGPGWRPSADLMFLHTTYTGPGFSTDIRGRVWEGGTVTNVTLQLAYYMGFSQAILIGVDHSYAVQGKPNTTVVSQGDDQSHFNPSYFGKGFRWQLPDLDTSERGYWLARQAYESAGRQVLDATVDGKLAIFPKVDFTSLF